MTALLRWRARKHGGPYIPQARPQTRQPASGSIPYEYAGFRFSIEADDINANGTGMVYIAVPYPGQHPAAYKDKHARAAIELWTEDGRPGL